jgi:hypothetical protein
MWSKKFLKHIVEFSRYFHKNEGLQLAVFPGFPWAAQKIHTEKSRRGDGLIAQGGFPNECGDEVFVFHHFFRDEMLLEY